MIRDVPIEELRTLLPLAERFHERTGAPGKFNSEAFIKTWTPLMRSGVVMVTARFVGGFPVESIGIVRGKDMLTGSVVSHVLFWMSPESESLAGGMLYVDVVQREQTDGSTSVSFMVPEWCKKRARFMRLLENSGFRKTETVYTVTF